MVFLFGFIESERGGGHSGVNSHVMWTQRQRGHEIKKSKKVRKKSV